MNLGFFQETPGSPRRPAERWEIQSRIREFRAWRILVAENLDEFTIEVEGTDDDGWRMALYRQGERIACQRYAWYPEPGTCNNTMLRVS